MALPTNVGTGTVTGKFVDGNGDPLAGTVTFTPSVKRLLNPTAVPPVTILPKPRTGILNAGVLSPLTLIATDDADLSPVNWTYEVTFSQFPDNVPDGFSISVPQGSSVDLTVVTPTSPSGGTPVVPPADIVEATTTTAGKVRRSTAAEVDNGTDVNAYTTPARVMALVTAKVAAVKAEILGGAASAWDTLQEVKDLIDAAEESSVISALTTVVGGKLAKDQNLADLTSPATARQNLGGTTVGIALWLAGNKAAARAAIGLVTGPPAADEYQLLDTASVGLGATQPPPAKGQFVMPSVTHGAQTPRAGSHYTPMYLVPGTYDALGINLNAVQVGGGTTFKMGLFKAHPLGLFDDSAAPLREATLDLTAGGTGTRPAVIADLIVTEPGWYYTAALYAVTTAPTTAATMLCGQGTQGYSLPWPIITGNAQKTAYMYLNVTAWPTGTVASDGTVAAGLTVNGNLNSPIVGLRRKAA